MYTKNPATGVYEGYATRSDLEKVEKKLNAIEAGGGTSAGAIAKANIANANANTQLDNANKTENSTTAIATAIQEGQASLATQTTSVSGSSSSSVKTKATSVKTAVEATEEPAETAVDRTEKVASDTDAFLECYVKMASRVADIDQLHSIGQLANNTDPVKYPLSHIERYNELPYGYTFPETVETNLMSLVSLPNNASQYRTNAVKYWNSDLPSLTVTENQSSPFYYNNSTALVEFNGQLPNLVKGDYLFYRCNKLAKFSVNLPSIESAKFMFAECNGNNLQISTTSMPRLTDGTGMFNRCASLHSFQVELPSLVNGTEMFINCYSLTNGPSFLPRLENGNGMFKYCEHLQEMTTEMPSLEDGTEMFYGCHGLATGPTALPRLKNGTNMFKETNLISCARNLASLENGDGMFAECTRFVDGPVFLNSLQSGNGMFVNCRLSAESLKGIMDTIPEVQATTEHKLTVGCLGDLSEKSCLQSALDKTLYEIGPAELVESIKAARTEKHWVFEADFYDRVGENYNPIPHAHIVNFTEVFGY